MFKRPTSRRKTDHKKTIELNLVPMLDALVTMIAFLLFTMSFLAIVDIESPAPRVSKAILNQRLKEKPLQLTLTIRAQEIELWSPFGKVRPTKIPNNAEGQPDLLKLHEATLEVKKLFPQEGSIVFMPFPGINYDVLISLMDTVRNFEKSDPPLLVKDAQTGIEQQITGLFPQIVFGNLLGDS